MLWSSHCFKLYFKRGIINVPKTIIINIKLCVIHELVIGHKRVTYLSVIDFFKVIRTSFYNIHLKITKVAKRCKARLDEVRKLYKCLVENLKWRKNVVVEKI